MCIDRQSNTLPALRQAGRFVVNYLLAGRGELSNRFAGRLPDRWAQVSWRPTPSGMPWLHQDSLAYAECAVLDEVIAGDHVIVIGKVESGRPPGTRHPAADLFSANVRDLARLSCRARVPSRRASRGAHFLAPWCDGALAGFRRRRLTLLPPRM